MGEYEGEFCVLLDPQEFVRQGRWVTITPKIKIIARRHRSVCFTQKNTLNILNRPMR